MRLDLADVGAETVTIDLPLVLTGLTDTYGEPMAAQDARLTAEARRTRGGVDLTGRVVARVELTCSRCAEDFDMPVDRAFRLLAVDPGRGVAPSGPATPEIEESGVLAAEEGQVDLVQVATEQIYLELPLKPVCRPDCQSLCPACGANRNRIECGCRNEEVDPRFGSLLEFRKRMGEP